MDLLSKDNESLKARISALEDNINSILLHKTMSVDNKLINKIIERQSRQKNILLFNLPEVVSKTNDLSNDDSNVHATLKFLQLNIPPEHITRLGTYSTSSSRPRPINITFLTEDPVLRVQN